MKRTKKEKVQHWIHQVQRTTVSIAVAACFSGTVLANPTNPAVVHGTASFATAGNILNITNSPNAIINWGSFSIGGNELTRFIQQSGSSSVLNRVIGQDPSAILGALQSNGRVFLVNPNGIVFGAGSQINVAGLVASTLNLSNEDFLSNRLNFTDGDSAGSVVNQGRITGGNVYLIGKAVTNGGLITGPNGEVVLAAGNSVELVNPGTPNLRVEVVASDNKAKNLGSITAEAGRIGIYAGLVNNSGTLNASSAVVEGGKILLKSMKNTTLESGSVISARGTSGGDIIALSGMTDGVTQVGGILDASGTAGNGGFVETSAAKVKVNDGTRVTTLGAAGTQHGKWLIDPNDYSISADGGDISGATLSSNLDSGDIEIQSVSGANPEGNGDIFVDDVVSWNSAFGLTLLADRNVTVNQSVSNAGSGAVKMYAGWNGVNPAMPVVTPGIGAVQLNAPVTTGGDVYLIAGDIVSQDESARVAANNLLAQDGYGGVNLDATANSVNVISGTSGRSFLFLNDKSLTVGAVGGVAGIDVNSSFGDAAVTVQVNGAVSESLTVNNNILAQAGDDGDANIALKVTGGSNGGITVNNSAMSALGGPLISSYGGSVGGAYTLIQANNGLVTVNNSTVQGLGGNSMNGAYYGGGYGEVDIYGSAIDIKNGSVIRGRGGNDAVDGSTNAGNGYIYMYGNGAGGVRIYSSLVESMGGTSPVGSQHGSGDMYLVAYENLDINGSNIAATGGAAAFMSISTTYPNGGSITASNSLFTAQGQPGADGASFIITFSAQNSPINAGSSTVSASGQTGNYSTAEFFAGGDITLGMVSAGDDVRVNSSNGAILDGNAGLNISAPQATLYGYNGIGSVANPLEMQVSDLSADSVNGGIGIINSGDLVLASLNAAADSVIGATGTLTVMDGGEGGSGSGGDLALLANGNLNIFGNVYADGNLLLQSGGNMTIGGPDADMYSSVNAIGHMSTTAVAGGNLSVLPSPAYPSGLGYMGSLTTVATGGNVLVDQSAINGGPDVMMNVGGVIDINGTVAYGGGVFAGSSQTIHLTFPNGISGGFFVNGIEGVVFDPVTNTGFFANGSAAVPGDSLQVVYGGGTLPPAPTAPATPTNTLIVALNESTKPPDAEKDKDVFREAEDDEKKDAPVCK